MVAAAELAAATAESRHHETLAALTAARIELDERRARRQRAADERDRARRRADSARARLALVDQRLASVPTAAAACADVVAALAALQTGIEPLIARLADEAREAEGRVRDRVAARRLAEDEVALRREIDTLGEGRGAAQVAVARLEERRVEVAARFDEISSALEVSVFHPPHDDDEAAALRERLERLERRRDGVGPVNPLAEAECARLSEHVEFLREQRRDLERSLDETEKLIVELTQRIEADFDETFAVVQGNFVHMVGILFPGGVGRLATVAGEADEPSGIAIEVKPARKLGRKLALLSGGERSLVALAFLLALLLSRTCPFYILDEVEAALDDLNIGLFVSLVREYRARTQFLIITHQKRTMEAADLLYGVTMGTDGTSQVVSARMAEQEIDHEAGATDVDWHEAFKGLSARLPEAAVEHEAEERRGLFGRLRDNIGKAERRVARALSRDHVRRHHRRALGADRRGADLRRRGRGGDGAHRRAARGRRRRAEPDTREELLERLAAIVAAHAAPRRLRRPPDRRQRASPR